MNTSQASIDAAYTDMQNNGWDTSEPLKWGFFFFGKNEDDLKGVYSELIESDYLVESVHENDDGNLTLCVSKVESLPADKLFRRCMAFNELAEAYGTFFDGWDVERVE